MVGYTEPETDTVSCFYAPQRLSAWLPLATGAAKLALGAAECGHDAQRGEVLLTWLARAS